MSTTNQARYYNILAKDEDSPAANVEVEVNDSGTALALDNQGNWFHREIERSSSTTWEKMKNVITSDSAGSTAVTGHLWLPPSSRSPEYDDDGNLTNDGRWEYIWDARSRLVKMKSLVPPAVSGPPTMANHGHQVLEFAYDWLGRRISKKVTTTTVAEVSGTLTATTATDQRTYLYDGWNLALSTQKKEGS